MTYESEPDEEESDRRRVHLALLDSRDRYRRQIQAARRAEAETELADDVIAADEPPTTEVDWRDEEAFAAARRAADRERRKRGR